MAATASMTLVALGAATALAGGEPRFIQAKPLDSTGLPSGSAVRLSSSNTAVAKVTTGEQLGAAPAGVVGISAGSATITATAADNTAITATLVITVS